MFVTIHGHFYQPPRENPWTGRVPRHEDAHPAHDWNDRITRECYRPNGWSRVLSPEGRIEDIVNNYEFLSFDFGPTLLTWLAEHAPDVYGRILEGDRRSRELQGGHGNAIAHAYNHMILPLANYRDKRTQIVWGLRDFEWRFGRRSESIWLAETAVNLETTKILIELGIRYIVLSPCQALRSRALDRRGGWTDARGGKIDPRHAYRFFLKDARKRRIADRFIDVFFYDGPVAADINFQHLLRSAPTLADRITQARGAEDDPAMLMSIATDGEVYGHHEPWADMCLAYLFRREGPRRGFQFINYGRYLDLFPPTREVDLDFGEHDEGTAWSCSHGVSRWERDCGCTTGGEPGWNQRWRAPLRRGFTMVRDRLVEIYLEQVSPLIKDAWAVRDDYISVLLDPSESSREAFLQRHQRKPLSGEERRVLWSLLESQRYAMLMFTSCGWFFGDISRVEAIRNMAYASMALELAGPWQAMNLESMLLEYLAEAECNPHGMGTGADVYRRFVQTERVAPETVAADLALTAAVLDEPPSDRRFRYRVVSRGFVRVPVAGGNGRAGSRHGVFELVDGWTEARLSFQVHVYSGSLGDVRCYVLPAESVGTAEAPWGTGAPPAEEEVRTWEGASRFTLSDLVSEDRERIIRTAYESILESQEHSLAQLFEESRDLISTLHKADVSVPPVIRAVAEHVLEHALEDLSTRLEASLFHEVDSRSLEETEETRGLLGRISDLLTFAREGGLTVCADSLSRAYGRVLERLLATLLVEANPVWAELAAHLIENSRRLEFPLDWVPLQDLSYCALKKHRDALTAGVAEASGEGGRLLRAFEALSEALNLSFDRIVRGGVGEDVAAAQPG